MQGALLCQKFQLSVQIKHINNQTCETDKMTDINLHAALMQWDLIKDISSVQTTVLTNKQAMSVILQ